MRARRVRLTDRRPDAEDRGVLPARAPWPALVLAAAIVAADVPARAAPPAAPVGDAGIAYEKLTLPNGLVVILSEDHRAPAVGLQILFRVGSAHAPEKRHGMASLLRALYERAQSRRLRAADRDALFQALGLEPWTVEAHENGEWTWTRALAPSRALPLLLWLESDRMAFARESVDADALHAAREAVDATAGSTSLSALIESELLRATFGAEHPYAARFYGPSELADVDVGEARAALGSLFVPGNAVLALSGDFSTPRAKELVLRYFGSIVSPPRRAPAIPPPASPTSERRVRIEADVPAPTVAVAWPAPPYFAEDDARLDVVAQLVDARLRAALVTPGIASSVHVRESSYCRGSMFELWVRGAQGHTAVEALATIDREIASLSASLSESALRGASLRQLTSALQSLDAPVDRAFCLAETGACLVEPALLDRRVAVHRDAAPEAMRALIATTLRADRRIVVEVAPTKGAPATGRLAGGKP